MPSDLDFRSVFQLFGRAESPHSIRKLSPCGSTILRWSMRRAQTGSHPATSTASGGRMDTPACTCRANFCANFCTNFCANLCANFRDRRRLHRPERKRALIHARTGCGNAGFVSGHRFSSRKFFEISGPFRGWASDSTCSALRENSSSFAMPCAQRIRAWEYRGGELILPVFGTVFGRRIARLTRSKRHRHRLHLTSCLPSCRRR